MSGATAPLLAALLARTLPELAVLDLGLGLFPWWPGAMPGIAEPAALLPAAERALLRRFRGPGGREAASFGLDPAADAALLAGAPAAWGAAPERLVCLPGAPRTPCLAALLRAGPPAPLVLLPGEVGAAPGMERGGQVILLLGSAARIRGWNLLLPAERVPAVFAALEAAAVALAGPGWQRAGRLLSPRTATFTLLAPEPEGFAPPLALPAEAWVHDGPLPAAAGRLPLGAAPRRLRLLLGRLPARPWRVRLCLHGLGPAGGAPVLFLDGLRLPTEVTAGEAGTTWVEAAIHPAPERMAVLGLALPPAAVSGGPEGCALARFELLP